MLAVASFRRRGVFFLPVVCVSPPCLSVARTLQVKTTPKLMERVRSGQECSPVQAKAELNRVVAEWRKVSEGMEMLMDGLRQDADVGKLVSFQSIPPTIVEAVLARADFTRVSTKLQTRLLGMLSRMPCGLTRLTLTGFTALNRNRLVGLAQTGGRLTVLKLTNCGNFNVNTKGCLVAIAKACPALEALHVDGSPQLDMIADVGWGLADPDPIKFASLRVLRLSRCPKLRRVLATFGGSRQVRVIMQQCLALKDVRLVGAVDWTNCLAVECMGSFDAAAKAYAVPLEQDCTVQTQEVSMCTAGYFAIKPAMLCTDRAFLPSDLPSLRFAERFRAHLLLPKQRK